MSTSSGKRTVASFAVAALLGALSLVSCTSDGGGSQGSSATTAPTYKVLRVPADHKTIAAAVDAAQPGDLVLISPGTYNEAVDVKTDNLTIRGLDRNTTILDGQFKLQNGIRVTGANGVSIENLTARNYQFNAFYWTGADGFRGSYLTAVRNGDYGIYGFGSVNGLFEHSYASGSPDAGFYLGQCYPCNTVISDVISEWNGLGYSGTNSGGDVYLINSVWRRNRAGIVPNTGSYELCYPQRRTTVVGNVVYDNNNDKTPAIDAAKMAIGNGILVAGGIGDTVERNLVYDHKATGIGLVPFPEEKPSGAIPTQDPGPCNQTGPKPDKPENLPDTLIWPAKDNSVRDNDVSGSGLADLATGSLDQANPSGGNCFSANKFKTSAPANIEQKAPCGGPVTGSWTEGALDLISVFLGDKPPAIPYNEATIPDPPQQPNMPDAATAPPRPAANPAPKVDVASIKLPTKPQGS